MLGCALAQARKTYGQGANLARLAGAAPEGRPDVRGGKSPRKGKSLCENLGGKQKPGPKPGLAS